VSKDSLGLEGTLTVTVLAEHPDRVLLEAGSGSCFRDGNIWVLTQSNAFVNTGLNMVLDRLFGVGGPPAAVGFIGVDNNNSAVTAATTQLHGGAGGAAANQIIKAVATPTRSGQTTTAGATFANADFTAGVFVINKIGLLNTSTDVGTGLVDVIGGAGGAAPFNRTLVIDLTAAGTFTMTVQVAVTAAAI
jgi:hypothetical protein